MNIVTVVKGNIENRCPKCGGFLLSDYCEPYCLFCGSPSKLGFNNMVFKETKKMIHENCSQTINDDRNSFVKNMVTIHLNR